MTSRLLHILGKVARRVRGFTLIETLVAVLLLASAIAGPLSIAAKGLTAALVARDQMVAFYLAQDAVEYVRFVRDSNKLSGRQWLTGLTPCQSSNGCTVDPSTGTVAPCGTTCEIINKYDDGDSHVYFTYDDGTPTPEGYIRTVKLSAPATGETTEEVLTVSVSWHTQGNIAHSIAVRENLLDWQ